jgi:hypothetical protein
MIPLMTVYSDLIAYSDSLIGDVSSMRTRLTRF